MQNRHVHYHLRIVLRLRVWNIRIRVWRERSLARLLLHQHRIVQLKEVHTSLQTKLFAEERRFGYHFRAVETKHLGRPIAI